MQGVSSRSHADLLSEYQQQQPHLQALMRRGRASIARLVQEAGIKIHDITARLKTPESLAEKLRRKGRYAHLSEVTDLVGLRVITYFENDVTAVARLLEAHFEVDWENSVDKSKMLDPDRFGYMGVHYVLRLGGESFEVQIRSILQHAWAEIEHDLGYKSREAVPREVQRRFYRLAGLLEMADEEFMAIHRLSQDYAAKLPQRIAEDPENVFIDAQSMSVLLHDPEIRQLDTQLAQSLNMLLLVGWPDSERAQRLAAGLHYVGVKSVGQLQKELRRQSDQILAFGVRLQPQLSAVWSPAGGIVPASSVVYYAIWVALHAGRSLRTLLTLLDRHQHYKADGEIIRATFHAMTDEG